MDPLWRLLSWIDTELVRMLPPLGRVVLWGSLAALVSMELYRALSPQRRIRAVEEALQRSRLELEAQEGGTFGDGWAVVRDMLRLSLRRVLLVAPAALVAWLPLLAVVLWMSGAYEGERILAVGPAWAGGWEATFFFSLTAAAFAVKSMRRIA
jgi:hypothetical protein